MPGPRLLRTPPLAVVLSAAVGSGCTTYSVRKSALAPHIAPPLRDGQGMGDADFEAAGGAAAVASGCATYTGPKSPLAPPTPPPLRDGQGMGDADFEAAVGASTAASAI